MSSMVAMVVRLLVLSGIGQVEPARMAPAHPSPPSFLSAAVVAREPMTLMSSVVAERLEVFDRPNEPAYVMATLETGDPVRVRKVLQQGWTVIDPPPMAIGWVPRIALKLDDANRRGESLDDPAGSQIGLPTEATIIGAEVVIRSGQLRAQMPGPPWMRLHEGDRVRLVDCKPLTVGVGKKANVWVAIVPPDGARCYVRTDGIQEDRLAIPTAAERLVSNQVSQDDPIDTEPALSEKIPADVAAEIRRIDAMHHTILASQPIEQWRFDSVRAGYQSILKRAGDNHTVEEGLRDRLTRVTRLEQASKAARTIQKTLEDSRRRDTQVAQIQNRLAVIDRSHTRTYNAIGFVQPSSRVIDGRKLHALIGSNGSTLAYLDIPLGVDVNSLETRRVGVLGVTHYNQELGTRLITVRDLEMLESRR